jgi:hypothetical protein
LIEDGGEVMRLGGLGIERARQFTWQACAEKTLAVYKKQSDFGNPSKSSNPASLFDHRID